MAENLMVQALHDFKSSTEEGLTFTAGELFIAVDQIDANWLWAYRESVRSDTGIRVAGFIPTAYVTATSCDHSRYLRTVEAVIEAINSELLAKGEQHQMTDSERRILSKLECVRSALKSGENGPSTLRSHGSCKREAPKPPTSPNTNENGLNTVKVPVAGRDDNSDYILSTLVEIIRTKTRAEHATCVEAIFGCLRTLKDACDGERSRNSSHMSQRTDNELCYCAKLLKYQGNVTVMNNHLEHTEDWFRLGELADAFKRRANEYANSGFEDDLGQVDNDLDNVDEILRSANPELSRRRLEMGDCELPRSLSSCYTFLPTKRVDSRVKLCRVLVSCCSLGKRAALAVLTSPAAVDILRDCTRFSELGSGLPTAGLRLLSMLLVTDLHTLPSDLASGLQESLYVELLSHCSDDPDDEYVHELTVFVLACNCIYNDPRSNTILQTFANDANCCYAVLQRVLHVFNSDNDPLAFFEYSEVRGSVVKLLTDVFSLESTADIIYTNDAHVLLNILCRRLEDLDKSNEHITDHLILLDMFTTNSQFLKDGYRSSDIRKILSGIIAAESISTDIQDLAKQIRQKLFQGISI